MNRAQKENCISEHLVGHFEVTCSKCETVAEIVAEDNYGAACYFYEEGWRTRDDELLCKKCRRKQ